MPALEVVRGTAALTSLLFHFNIGSSLRIIHFGNEGNSYHLFAPRLLERYRLLELLIFAGGNYESRAFKPLLTYATRHPCLKAICFTDIGFSRDYNPRISYQRSCPYEITKVEREEIGLNNTDDDSEGGDDGGDDNESIESSITQLEERLWSSDSQLDKTTSLYYTVRPIRHVVLELDTTGTTSPSFSFSFFFFL